MDEWEDCTASMRYWIYRDYQGRWHMANYTERRSINRDGKPPYEYRERKPTTDELSEDAW